MPLPFPPNIPQKDKQRREPFPIQGSGKVVPEQQSARGVNVEYKEKHGEPTEELQFDRDLHETSITRESRELATEQAQATTSSQPTALPKNAVLIEIENILSDDLEDIYKELEPSKKAEFKAVGEEIALKIEALLAIGKNIAKKIVQLIKKWLKLIPHVNKYFLDQEAKIKTDRILDLQHISL